MSSNTPDFGPFIPQAQTGGIFEPAPGDPPTNGQGKNRGKTRDAKATGRKGRGRPRSAPVAAADPPAPSKRPRKVRLVKVDLGLALSALAGLTEDDSRFVTGCVQAMSAFPIGRKRRIVTALGKLFA